jgi:hypothetical protein
MEGLVKPSEDVWLGPIFDIQGVIFYLKGFDIGERSIFRTFTNFYYFHSIYWLCEQSFKSRKVFKTCPSPKQGGSNSMFGRLKMPWRIQ